MNTIRIYISIRVSMCCKSVEHEHANPAGAMTSLTHGNPDIGVRLTLRDIAGQQQTWLAQNISLCRVCLAVSTIKTSREPD